MRDVLKPRSEDTDYVERILPKDIADPEATACFEEDDIMGVLYYTESYIVNKCNRDTTYFIGQIQRDKYLLLIFYISLHFLCQMHECSINLKIYVLKKICNQNIAIFFINKNVWKNFKNNVRKNVLTRA